MILTFRTLEHFLLCVTSQLFNHATKFYWKCLRLWLVVSRPLATVAWCTRTDQTVCQWFTAGSSWSTLWPLGNRLLQTAWLRPTGGLCQPQSMPQKGSLGGGVCGLTTIHHWDSHVNDNAVTQEGADLDCRPEINACLDQRPEIITRSFLLWECKHHVMVSIQFERCPSSNMHLHYNLFLERVRFLSHLITILRKIYVREDKVDIQAMFVSVKSVVWEYQSISSVDAQPSCQHI